MDKQVKQDRLHALVHAMSKSEKRHFLLMSGLTQQEGDKRYVEIFKYLQEMEAYDEALLKRRLKKSGFPTKNLAQDRSYLYQQILKSLCWLNRQHDPQARARELLDASGILMSKGLYSQASSACKRAKSIIEDHQLLHLLPDVLLMGQKVLARQASGQSHKEEADEILQALGEIRLFVETDSRYRDAMELYAQMGKVRSVDDAAKYEVILRGLDLPPDAPIHTLIRKEQAKAVVHFAKGETEQEHGCISHILQLMEQHPKFKEVNLYEYVVFQSHALRLAKYVAPEAYPKAFSDFLAMAEDMGKGQVRLKALIYSLAYSTETVRLLDKGLFEEGIALIPKLQGILERYGKHISLSVQMTFKYKFAYFHYRNGDLTQGLSYINDLLNHYQEADRKDVFMYARILSLVIHFDLGNEVLVSYNGRSLRAFLKKREVLDGLEGILLDAIRQLSKAKSAAEKIGILAQVRKNLDTRLASHPKERGLLIYFDVWAWLEAKEKALEGI